MESMNCFDTKAFGLRRPQKVGSDSEPSRGHIHNRAGEPSVTFCKKGGAAA